MATPRTKRLLFYGLALLALGSFGYVIGAGTGVWREHSTFGDWFYIGLVMAAGLLCFGRAGLVRAQRGAWIAIGIGLALGALGDLYYLLFLQDLASPPYPSPADALWLAVYPATGLGLWLLLAQRDTPLDGDRAAWLDGIVAASAGTAVAAATLLAGPLEAAMEGRWMVFATNLSYPLADLLLLGVVLVLCARTAWRPGIVGGLLAASLLIRALTDFVYLDQTTRDTYVLNGLLDAGWVVAPLLAAAAGCLFLEQRRRPSAWRIYAGLLISMSAALVVQLYDHFDRLNTLALALASIALALGVVRAALAVRSVLSASQREALTDPLTGLGNRRALATALEDAFDQVSAQSPMTVASFDLNGFKRYNDSYGHPAGDALLERLSVRLAAAVDGCGSAYRVGGDEFCVLLGPGHHGRVDAAVNALSEIGEGFTVKTAHGSITIPDEADGVESALKLVDERLYANKLSRHASTDTVEALLRTLHESEPEIETHLGNVAALAREVARTLELGGEDIDVITRAAQLHDIGKLAIPDAILHKPAPLNDAEWTYMRSHTLIGERIIASAAPLLPVARIVRSSHERWDGGGYPDGLAGEKIPRGARIVFACDAYDAITSTREYRAARTPEDAIGELRRCSGTQLDPTVVDTLLNVLARDEHHPASDESPRTACRPEHPPPPQRRVAASALNRSHPSPG